MTMASVAREVTWYELGVASSWACAIGPEAYARAGRKAPAPRLDCRKCGKPMAFDGSYPRSVRHAGVVHRIFVRRARCRHCGVGDALLPSFVVRRRHDSAEAVGAAVLERAGVELPAGAAELYAGVPARTVRSWSQRFSRNADELAVRFNALCVERGGDLPRTVPTNASGGAAVAIGALWRAARCPGPGAWVVANIILGGAILASRVDLPWPILPAWIGRSRGP